MNEYFGYKIKNMAIILVCVFYLGVFISFLISILG